MFWRAAHQVTSRTVGRDIVDGGYSKGRDIADAVAREVVPERHVVGQMLSMIMIKCGFRFLVPENPSSQMEDLTGRLELGL